MRRCDVTQEESPLNFEEACRKLEIIFKRGTRHILKNMGFETRISGSDSMLLSTSDVTQENLLRPLILIFLPIN